MFEPDYLKLPDDVPFYYNGERIRLNEGAEEVMGFYAKMLDHDYIQKEAFNTNFFNDWRKVRINNIIKLKKVHIYSFYLSLYMTNDVLLPSILKYQIL